MDVITAYLYGLLENAIYMEIPERYKITNNTKQQHLYSIKLQRSLYGLKQSGRIWYNRFSDYLIKEGYQNNNICLCVFIRSCTNKFVMVAVYVDDLNLIGTSHEIASAASYLRKEFEMKDLGKTKFCLGIQIEHLSMGIFIHQSTYTEKMLKRFNMDKAYPLSTPMVLRTLDVQKDQFRPPEER